MYAVLLVYWSFGWYKYDCWCDCCCCLKYVRAGLCFLCRSDLCTSLFFKAAVIYYIFFSIVCVCKVSPTASVTKCDGNSFAFIYVFLSIIGCRRFIININECYCFLSCFSSCGMFSPYAYGITNEVVVLHCSVPVIGMTLLRVSAAQGRKGELQFSAFFRWIKCIFCSLKESPCLLLLLLLLLLLCSTYLFAIVMYRIQAVGWEIMSFSLFFLFLLLFSVSFSALYIEYWLCMIR